MRLDRDGAVCATTVALAKEWTKKSYESLLAQQRVETLHKDALRTEKNAAFDLLDALSRSGDLPLSFVQVHVVILQTHTFGKSLLHTLTRDNVNPIERVEATHLILASELHGAPPAALVERKQLARLREHNGHLLDEDNLAPDE